MPLSYPLLRGSTKLLQLSLFFLILSQCYCHKSNNQPKSIQSSLMNSNLEHVSRLISSSMLAFNILSTPKPSLAAGSPQFDDKLLDSDTYSKPLFNLPPTEFHYPNYFEGIWKTNLSFLNAKFTSTIPFSQLAKDVNIAGFRRYGVLFVPDVGSNIDNNNNVYLQYKPDKSNGYIVEDRISNVASLFKGFTQSFNTDIDTIIYDTDMNPNRMSVTFHDPNATGRIELFTNSRNMQVYTDNSSNSNKSTVTTLEYVRQSTVRQKSDQRASQTIVDYAIEWTLSPSSSSSPSSPSPLSETETINRMEGTLKILSYVQPQDELYFIRPNKPVAVYTYNVILNKVI